VVQREDYERREQAYVKHFVLKHYLQQLALKIGNFKTGTTLNYIDGFSGPWQYATDELRDTSPHVALTELCAAREVLRGLSRPSELHVRGMFVESDREAFVLLERLLRDKFPSVDQLVRRRLTLDFWRRPHPGGPCPSATARRHESLIVRRLLLEAP